MSGIVSFIDSNVWLYAITSHSGAEEKARIAAELVRRPGKVISTQVINEVCVNFIKKGHATEEQITGLIRAFYRQCQVVEFDREILLTASGLRQRYSFSYWDSLIVSCALSAGVAILYSEDMQDGLALSDSLTIVNPSKPRP